METGMRVYLALAIETANFLSIYLSYDGIILLQGLKLQVSVVRR
jgi:hypothetical protein